MTNPLRLSSDASDECFTLSHNLGTLNDYADYFLDVARFRRLQKLADGAFGSVYEAEDTFTGWRVALKELHCPELSPRELELFKREILILCSARNPFVLPCVGFSLREKSCQINHDEFTSGLERGKEG
jgi:serine/threonine protein kinase